MPDDSTFGARLALVRQRMGWNVKEASLACGVPQASWREWEFSARRPRELQDVCEQIAKRTGCDDIWLMTGRNQPRDGGDGGGGSTLQAPTADKSSCCDTRGLRGAAALRLMPIYQKNDEAA